MTKRLLAVSLLLFILLFYAQYGISQQSIRELPVDNLNDIAVASLDAYGPMIYFNPTVCRQAGPLVTAFFKMHEYGHHNLGHIIQRVMNPNNPYVQSWLNLNSENEVDAYAARYWIEQGNKAVIQAWVNHMFNLNNPGDATHAPSRVRANNIIAFYSQLTRTSLFP